MKNGKGRERRIRNYCLHQLHWGYGMIIDGYGCLLYTIYIRYICVYIFIHARLTHRHTDTHTYIYIYYNIHIDFHAQMAMERYIYMRTVYGTTPQNRWSAQRPRLSKRSGGYTLCFHQTSLGNLSKMTVSKLGKSSNYSWRDFSLAMFDS